MSSFTENQQAFATEVMAKNLAKPMPIYQSQFYRLYFTRRFCEWLFSTILIFGGQQFLLQNGLFSAVWPAAGVGLSAIFLRGYLLLLGVMTGTLASYLYNSYPFTVSFANSFVFTANLFLIRYCCLRFFGAMAPLHTTRICFQFICVTLFFCALHTGWQYLFYPDLPWLMAFLGESNGILCLTPLCLVLEPFTVKKLFMKGSLPAWIVGTTIVIAQSLFFFVHADWAPLWASGLLVAMCLFAYHYRGAATGMLLLGVSVVYLTGSFEPFEIFQRAWPLKTTIIVLGLFTLSCLFSLLLACRCTLADFKPLP